MQTLEIEIEKNFLKPILRVKILHIIFKNQITF